MRRQGRAKEPLAILICEGKLSLNLEVAQVFRAQLHSLFGGWEIKPQVDN